MEYASTHILSFILDNFSNIKVKQINKSCQYPSLGIFDLSILDCIT